MCLDLMIYNHVYHLIQCQHILYKVMSVHLAPFYRRFNVFMLKCLPQLARWSVFLCAKLTYHSVSLCFKLPIIFQVLCYTMPHFPVVHFSCRFFQCSVPVFSVMMTCRHSYLSWLSYSYKLVKNAVCLSVCLCVWMLTSVA